MWTYEAQDKCIVFSFTYLRIYQFSGGKIMNTVIKTEISDAILAFQRRLQLESYNTVCEQPCKFGSA